MNCSQFCPGPADSADVVSWIHLGDLHMQSAEDQNYQDLLSLVHKINANFAQAISFVMLPGDNANEGSEAQYQVVRSALDRLRAPWCAIVGDHDVHEKSFDNFLRFMHASTHYDFAVGNLRFFALNAFSTPDPGSFDLDTVQLDWLEREISHLAEGEHAVLLLHCYPSELHAGAERLQEIVKNPRVLLIDMGHTHYNEVSNDGNTLYTATRSTGQIEEGPVGFSLTNVDGDVVSWKFAQLSDDALVMITSPADDRFVTASNKPFAEDEMLSIRAKVWGMPAGCRVTACIEGQRIELHRVRESNVFAGNLPQKLNRGVHKLVITAGEESGTSFQDEILVRVGERDVAPARKSGDVENALEAWPERGLLGTQLGPNKNGRKW